MLADCVEAAARTIQDLTPETLNHLVDSTIIERHNDKQFKAANIKEKEMLAVSKSLKETLNAIYHQRITY